MPFEGFDHVDLRVPALRDVEPFYDRFFPELGLSRKAYIFIERTPAGDDWRDVTADDRYNALEYHEEPVSGKPSRFISLVEAAQTAVTGTRIAFRLASIAALEDWEGRLWAVGAGNIERSEDMESYPALFFEDPSGTKLELCVRRRAP
jgi:hypothetical protein